ncbi:MAG: hypothetical protein KC656_26425 [Myxococcales bacterium]|nr:hypothetical protein [Myxococcales bacterium]
MSSRKLLSDFAHALRTFLDLSEDDDSVEAWDRTAVFRTSSPETSIWSSFPCADNPPTAYLLMAREVDDEPVWELLWDNGEPEASWPVVEVTASGDAQVLAASASDYLDALLYTRGALGGGSEEDLEDAREDATNEATDLASSLLDELDRDEADPETLGDAFDDAQDAWQDAWIDAIEGIEQ